MKKTFTANLNGTVFHIEEDAYDQLQRYLANIRAKFAGSAEAEEIMADIEARIAELFQERLQGRQAVSLGDVDHVKQVMGQPEDYVDDEAAQGTTGGGASRGYTAEARHKRLFRNPDDRWVGGVLSGVATFFGHDPLWYRIAFIIILIGGWGSPVLLYLVMWALVPEANTAAEKLEMHGEPVTVDNIKRMFEEGAERVKAGAEKVASEARTMGRKYKEQGYRMAHETQSAGHRILDVFGKLLGIFLLFISIIVGLTLVSALVGTAGWGGISITGGTGLPGLAGFIFPDAATSILFTTSVLALCLIPVVLLLLGSLWLLFRVRTPRWVGWSLTVAFIAALALACWSGIRLGMDFSNRAEESTATTLPAPSGGLLTVKVGNASSYTEYHAWGFMNGRFYLNSNVVDLTGDSVHFSISHLTVEASPDSSFHLVSRRLARGGSVSQALARAGHISNSFSWQDDTLSLSSRFSFPKGDRMRAQHVRYVLQVPMNGRIHLMRGTERLMEDWFDMDDFGSNLDRDMVGKTWTMTRNGLREEGAPPPASGGGSSGEVDDADGPVAVLPAPAMPNLVHLLRNVVRI